ncbi:hypothetical protein O6H91_21G047900 [Diphasiastrum complanatum]|uniref:Uncharacterized protein n=1 Tax=Diphasiastrum complanatum TaxID=34168 RepID=A0ACC2AK70_DIPCM|nr:hypothetical protein O6H91_21G047900 [Diphasiastrum complanatum]
MTRGNIHAYGDASYWDNRYLQDAGSFDWYQRYTGIAPLLQKYIPKKSQILMVGCGNAVISEDMINDGYQEIVNIDISSVVINAMLKKYKDIPQLKYMTMDVRDMSAFEDSSFDGIVDKGMLDSLMCGTSAALSASEMLMEVRRVLKPGGTYILVTYGDPSVRMPHLKLPEYNWNILLHVIPRPGSKRALENTSKMLTDPIRLNDDGTSAPNFVKDDPDLHYVYACIKATEAGSRKDTSHGSKQVKRK